MGCTAFAVPPCWFAWGLRRLWQVADIPRLQGGSLVRYLSTLAHPTRVAFVILALVLAAMSVACGSDPAPTAVPATIAPTATLGPTDAPIATPAPTNTPAPMATATIAPTDTPAPTVSPIPVPTSALTPTATPPPTPTPTPEPTPMPLPTYTPAPTYTLVPLPTATPYPTSTPMPTSTPRPTATLIPTSTSIPTATVAALPTVECSPKPCDTDYAPVVAHVNWVKPPQVTADGKFTLVARIHNGHDLIIATPAPNGGRLNLHFSRGSTLFGSILPVDNTPGWKWSEKPTTWEADVYTYENKVLTVEAQINPAAATHPNLRMCLWRGGKTRDDTYILGCTEVEQP